MKRIDIPDPMKLPGYLKKSFSLPFHGGEIWFEHLDGIYGSEELVIEKLRSDSESFSRPSSPGLICFVLDETIVTDNIINTICGTLEKKHFTKACFVGADRKTVRKLKSALNGYSFAVNFTDSLEQAKVLLVDM